MILRLASEYARFVLRPLIVVGRQFGVIFRYTAPLLICGEKLYPKPVIALFYNPFHRHAPLCEHIVGFEHERVVEIYLGVCIETQEIEHQRPGRQLPGGRHENGLVLPLLVLYPLQPALIGRTVRVVDKPVSQQVGMHHARNYGRIPLLGARTTKTPSRIQRGAGIIAIRLTVARNCKRQYRQHQKQSSHTLHDLHTKTKVTFFHKISPLWFLS